MFNLLVRCKRTVHWFVVDFFCDLLANELNGAVDFTVPDGGMTVWTEFDKSINLEELARLAYDKGLYISNGKIHQYPSFNKNAIRLGFASSSIEDLTKSILILKDII